MLLSHVTNKQVYNVLKEIINHIKKEANKMSDPGEVSGMYKAVDIIQNYINLIDLYEDK